MDAPQRNRSPFNAKFSGSILCKVHVNPIFLVDQALPTWYNTRMENNNLYTVTGSGFYCGGQLLIGAVSEEEAKVMAAQYKSDSYWNVDYGPNRIDHTIEINKLHCKTDGYGVLNEFVYGE